MRYRVFLNNHQGATFDNLNTSSMAYARKWAKGRGGEYSMALYDDQNFTLTMYKIKNDRFYLRDRIGKR